MMSKKIKIITDSVADLPHDWLKANQVSLVPTYVNFEGESYADDGVELDRSDFYRRLPDMTEFPTTAAPSPLIAQEIVSQDADEYDHIISINVPSRYSVTMNNIKLGTQETLADKMTFVDAGTLTMAIGLQVMIAKQVAEETGDVDAVLKAIGQVRQHQQLYAVIATMEYLKRSGRVNTLLAAIGTLLQLKPIVSVYDSDIKPVQRIRTMKKATARLIDMVHENAPLDQLVVLHIQNETGAQYLYEQFKDIAPDNTQIVEVGPTLGTHLGPGSIGATFLPKGWNDN